MTIVSYPDADHALIAAARDALSAAEAATNATATAIKSLEATLSATQERRSAALDRAAAGDEPSAAFLATLERNISSCETAIAQRREILARQESAVRHAAEVLQQAPGLAQRPRVVTAIREKAAACKEIAAAREALAAAEARDAMAVRVITEAFSFGFPMPAAIRPTGGFWSGPVIPDDGGEAALRKLWGELADDALGRLPEPPPPPQKTPFVFSESFVVEHDGGVLEIVAGRLLRLTEDEQAVIVQSGRVLPPAQSLEAAK